MRARAQRRSVRAGAAAACGRLSSLGAGRQRGACSGARPTRHRAAQGGPRARCSRGCMSTADWPGRRALAHDAESCHNAEQCNQTDARQRRYCAASNALDKVIRSLIKPGTVVRAGRPPRLKRPACHMCTKYNPRRQQRTPGHDGRAVGSSSGGRGEAHRGGRAHRGDAPAHIHLRRAPGWLQRSLAPSCRY